MLARACAGSMRVRVAARAGVLVVRERHRGRPKVAQAQVPPFDPVPAALRAMKAHPRVYPWPDEPLRATRTDPRTQADTWLRNDHNRGNGVNATNLSNFHWRLGNALDLNAVRELDAHLRRIDQGFARFKVCILRSQRGHDLCPGADLVRLLDRDLEYNRAFFAACQQLVYTMTTMRPHLITMAHGKTTGLGACLAMHAPLRAIDENAEWSLPQTLYGAYPDMGASFFLSRLDGELGLFLALTGYRLMGGDLMRQGVGTHYVPLVNLPQFEQDTTRLGDDSTHDLLMFFYNYQKLVPKGSSIDAHIATIHRVFGQPTLVEIFAALEAEDTPWARIVLARLRQCSPLMLHVTFRLMRMARHFTSLEEALTLDHRLTQCMVEGDELYIGLRARLKDHAEPQWTYASVEEVPNEAVARFFTYRPIQELELQPTYPFLKPSADPFRYLEHEAEMLINHPVYEHLVQRTFSRLVPPEMQNSAVIMAFYKKIFREGGMESVASKFYYRSAIWHEINDDTAEELKKSGKIHSLEETIRNDTAMAKKYDAIGGAIYSGMVDNG